MPFNEEAKAAQEIAKTTAEGIKAAKEAGSFMAKFVEGPLVAASGIIEDKLRYIRWERQQRFAKRANEFLTEAGLGRPSRRLPLNVGIPLIEAATIEEDDELQDVWARLLVNAANASSGVEIKRSFISILQDMSSLDVRIMSAIVNAPNEFISEHGEIFTQKLPNEYIHISEGKNDVLPAQEVQLSLWNLVRLGCITPILLYGGFSIREVSPSILGRSLVEACTIRS